MKLLSVVFITFAVLFLLHDVSADTDDKEQKPLKKKHHKKHRKHKTTTTVLPSSEDPLEVVDESYFDKHPVGDDVINRKTLLERIAEGGEPISSAPLVKSDEEEKEVAASRDSVVLAGDLCRSKHCGAGRECEINEDGEPVCICIKTCPQEEEARRKVCTNFNETWGSDCEVYQKRCQCEENSSACDRQEYAHVHIEYYGQCRQMPECLPAEMADFPRRMRDWLFHVMRDMADRAELSPHFMELQREAETNLTRRWSNAAVWKFCDLDGHPADRSVSRHELFPIRAPLMALEHCIAPFLNKCDADDNHLITLKEWARCLELNEDDIEDQCEDVRDNKD